MLEVHFTLGGALGEPHVSVCSSLPSRCKAGKGWVEAEMAETFMEKSRGKPGGRGGVYPE